MCAAGYERLMADKWSGKRGACNQITQRLTNYFAACNMRSDSFVMIVRPFTTERIDGEDKDCSNEEMTDGDERHVASFV